MSTAQLNKIFDIKSEIDDVLNDIETHQADNSKALEVINKLTFDTKNWDFTEIDNKGFDLTFEELHDLILCGKQIITHVENTIVTTDVIDPEILGGLGKLIEATHLILSEYISIYKDKIAFANKVKLAILQKEHKKELLKYKHELDLEKMAKAQNAGAITVETVPYDQTNIIKMLNEIDKNTDENDN